MESNMMNDMHLGIERTDLRHPYGVFIGIGFSFVGRSFIAFHNLPIVLRPYRTFLHR